MYVWAANKVCKLSYASCATFRSGFTTMHFIRKHYFVHAVPSAYEVSLVRRWCIPTDEHIYCVVSSITELNDTGAVSPPCGRQLYCTKLKPDTFHSRFFQSRVKYFNLCCCYLMWNNTVSCFCSEASSQFLFHDFRFSGLPEATSQAKEHVFRIHRAKRCWDGWTAESFILSLIFG